MTSGRGQPWRGRVDGLAGPTPARGVNVNVTSWAPAGRGVGSVIVAVRSSLTSKAVRPSETPPEVALTEPAQPSAPVPQLTWTPARWSAVGWTVVLVTISSEGKLTPVAVSSPCGSKQPSNSETG